jgi:molybdopterin molybdotransferase
MVPESASVGRHFDVRMRGFRDRVDVEDVRVLLTQRVQSLATEEVDVRQAAGRVLARDIVAEISVPHFDRSAMDGFALRGEETFGASAYNPIDFVLTGEARPGRSSSGLVSVGHAVRIMTGAPIPPGADAVVMAEAAEERTLEGRRIVRVTEPVPPGRHVGKRGEDLSAGETVLPAGRLLRPQDAAVLAAIGQAHVPVVRRPVVELLITGDELLPPGSRPQGCAIVDSNSVMLEALVVRDGGVPRTGPILPDRRDTIRQAVLDCRADVLLISGGSSVGPEDHAPNLVAELGELAVHGVAMRPSSPTGVGFVQNHPVFLLPGNPVSCLAAYDFFAGPAIRRLNGRSMDWPYRRSVLPLARKIVSVVGRVDYVRVLISNGQVEPLATSGASILSSTTRAAGFVIVPRDREGNAAGDLVEVFLYDG